MPKTKIVCTIGPASQDVETLRALIQSGMDIARLNFSHGSHEEFRQRIQTIRQVARELDRTVAILLDTQGPEIRTGPLREPEVHLEDGQPFVLTTREVEGDAGAVSITYKGLPEDVSTGDVILIDDGLLELVVEEVRGDEIHTRVRNGGMLKPRKGVNVPGVKIRLPGITEKDARDIRFGVAEGVDFIAASFVRKPADILEIHRILDELGAYIPIIAKIENQEGVDHLEAILEVADGLMVARGDLGVEIPVEEVPLVQKKIIQACNRAGKPVITATQMLDSMQRHPRPTRAEASDVANAILDGTDAIMLSGETATGRYPVEAVQMMCRIAESVESSVDYREKFASREKVNHPNTTSVISQSVVEAALQLNASAIIAPTESGYTARMISKYRPQCPIVAVTYAEATTRRLTLSWGVVPIQGEEASSMDEMLSNAVESALARGIIDYGDLVIITAGVPIGQVGTTNMMKVHVVGNVLAKGQGIGHQVVSGRVVKGTHAAELRQKMTPNAILVAPDTDREMVDLFEQAICVITEQGGLTSHAAIVGLELGVPVIVGVEGAMRLLEDGQELTVDCERGYIYSGKTKVF